MSIRSLVELFSLAGLVLLLQIRVEEFWSLIGRAPLETALLIPTLFISYVWFIPSNLRVVYIAALIGVIKYLFDQRGLAIVFDEYAKLDLSGKLFVVTGANNGIGLALTRQLAEQGAEVVMACRSLRKCEDAKKEVSMQSKAIEQAKCMTLDLADLESVRTFASALKAEVLREGTERERGIDYLVNNAGLVSGIGQRTKQGLETNFGVMHVGHFLLTSLLLENVQYQVKGASTAPARIVNHASAAFMGGHFDSSLFDGDGEGDLRGEICDGCPQSVSEMGNVYNRCFGDGKNTTFKACDLKLQGICPIMGSYSRAKLAQVLFTRELQRRLDSRAPSLGKRQVIVSTLHPGSVQSGLVQVTDLLVRPTAGGAAVLMHCLFGSYLPGSYIDSMLGYHTLEKTFNVAEEAQSNIKFIGMGLSANRYISVPGWFFQRAITSAMGKSAEEVQARLWKVTEILCGTEFL